MVVVVVAGLLVLLKEAGFAALHAVVAGCYVLHVLLNVEGII